MKFELLEGKKYSLSDKFVEYDGRRLYQIYTSKFVNVGGGCVLTQRGGYVESEDNLSHEGDCWIEEGCCVYGGARVEGNAIVKCDDDFNPSIICGKTTIKDDAVVISSILKGRQTIGRGVIMSWNTIEER